MVRADKQVSLSTATIRLSWCLGSSTDNAIYYCVINNAKENLKIFSLLSEVLQYILVVLNWLANW